MSAVEPLATTDGNRSGTTGRIVVRVVFGLLSAYVLWQSIGNLVTVVQNVHAFNAFVTGNGGATLARSVPWTWLVVDVLVAPVAYVVAWFVTRRTTLARMVGVFFVAFAAAGVVWLDLQLYVPSLLNL
ncbi:hypothetical protein [Curtobacterium sp. RRHDQ10]|uniref:hypothetical protein n=1 Tax=Curtobacterium phyllosphaerae TaxID=3413379 RepID=UPI003BF43C43